MTTTGPGIQDYGLIGDCRGAALVSNQGGIDWLCWPRFDSPSLFSGLLDRTHGGTFSISPREPYDVQRRYVPDTNVLETTFLTSAGELTLTDFMSVASDADRRKFLMPEHEIVRLVEGHRGTVALSVVFDPRPHYASEPARLRDRGRSGVQVETRDGLLALAADVPFRTRDGGGLESQIEIRAGQRLAFSLTFATEQPAVIPATGERSLAALRRSLAWWRDWAAICTYDGPHRDAVMRSALALKLMSFAPSGAIIAAPTTSLPERPGGDLNWDYRYCWLRDAAFTVRAFHELGYEEEARAYVSWLLHATRLTRPQLRILYDVFGRSLPEERTLDHLPGFEGARPVRIGNGAREQLQLDVYGEVIDAVARIHPAGVRMDRETGRMLVEFGDFVCHNWQKPDEGIWEPRSGKRRHTHSRVLCWTALDRLIALHRRGALVAPLADFERNRALLRSEIESDAWNETVGAYTQIRGGRALDASALLMGWYGFHEPSSERMRRTYAAIRRELGAGPALLYRYRRDDAPEGAFGICSCWAIEQLARGGGTLAEAREAIATFLTYGNDLGLFAEEIDPASGTALGNFPQAFTHVGLINAALSVCDRERSEARGTGRRSSATAMELGGAR